MAKINILQVNTSDLVGGAEKIGLTLHQGYQKRGYNSWLAVGKKKSTLPEIMPINQEVDHGWGKFWLTIGNSLSPFAEKNKIAAKIQHLLVSRLGQPHRWLKEKLGQENFYFPASNRILDLPPQKPDILHCHNLHGNYFDLNHLALFSQQIPVILTLHDAWLLSGHCAHSLGCDRWKTGCGQCPYLTIYPAIQRDGTAYNWHKKREIYARSKLYVVTPSNWLMSQVEQSILKKAVVKSKVIPNGIDLSIFKPVDKYLAREKLGISQNAKILLFTANFIQNKNPFKDYETIQGAVQQLAENFQGGELILLVLGDFQPSKEIGNAKIQFIPFQQDSSIVAYYYQAADVYVHGAKADTFPNIAKFHYLSTQDNYWVYHDHYSKTPLPFFHLHG
ncbi:MAG: glycosyltransferase [Microcoleaceae cyanobacterium]